MDTLNGRTKPNFAVVGAAKAGTTSLYSWLKQHPEVFVPEVKEPSYFVHGYGFNDWDRYLGLFQLGRGKKAIGDTSASYLPAPEAPKWMHELLGDIKIIMILRNPVQRAFSLYLWMVMEGYENHYPFEDGLAVEEARFNSKTFYWNNPEYFWDYMYFRSGRYYDQVQRYFDVFGRENTRVYLFDDLVRDNLKFYQGVCRFLGVASDFIPCFNHENLSRRPYSVRLQYFLRVELDRAVRKLPHKLIRDLAVSGRGYLMKMNRSYWEKPNIVPGTKRRLCQMYQDDVERLSVLLDKDLSSWID